MRKKGESGGHRRNPWPLRPVSKLSKIDLRGRFSHQIIKISREGAEREGGRGGGEGRPAGAVYLSWLLRLARVALAAARLVGRRFRLRRFTLFAHAAHLWRGRGGLRGIAALARGCRRLWGWGTALAVRSRCFDRKRGKVTSQQREGGGGRAAKVDRGPKGRLFDADNLPELSSGSTRCLPPFNLAQVFSFPSFLINILIRVSKMLSMSLREVEEAPI